MPAIEGQDASAQSYMCLPHVAFDIGPANEPALWQTATRHLALATELGPIEGLAKGVGFPGGGVLDNAIMSPLSL